jgi:hypothetical protein
VAQLGYNMARDKILRVRLSDAEWKMIQEMAQADDLPIADWVRTQIRVWHKQQGSTVLVCAELHSSHD